MNSSLSDLFKQKYSANLIESLCKTEYSNLIIKLSEFINLFIKDDYFCNVKNLQFSKVNIVFDNLHKYCQFLIRHSQKNIVNTKDGNETNHNANSFGDIGDITTIGGATTGALLGGNRIMTLIGVIVGLVAGKFLKKALNKDSSTANVTINLPNNNTNNILFVDSNTATSISAAINDILLSLESVLPTQSQQGNNDYVDVSVLDFFQSLLSEIIINSSENGSIHFNRIKIQICTLLSAKGIEIIDSFQNSHKLLSSDLFWLENTMDKNQQNAIVIKPAFVSCDKILLKGTVLLPISN